MLERKAFLPLPLLVRGLICTFAVRGSGSTPLETPFLINNEDLERL